MRLNAKCDYGELRVKILDEKDQPIHGYTESESIPVCADGAGLPVRWKERRRLDPLKGQKARLRFLLKNARFYSYRCVFPEA